MNLSINLWYPPTLFISTPSLIFIRLLPLCSLSVFVSHCPHCPALTPYLYDKTVLGQCSNLPSKSLLVRIETLVSLCSILTQNPWTQRWSKTNTAGQKLTERRQGLARVKWHFLISEKPKSKPRPQHAEPEAGAMRKKAPPATALPQFPVHSVTRSWQQWQWDCYSPQKGTKDLHI